MAKDKLRALFDLANPRPIETAEDFDPPAIMICWSPQRRGWVATAVCAIDPIEVVGPSSGKGRNPGDALAMLLINRFAARTDADCPATMIALEVFPDPGQGHANG